MFRKNILPVPSPLHYSTTLILLVPKFVGFPHTNLGTLWFNSVLTPSTWRQPQTPRLRAQSYRTSAPSFRHQSQVQVFTCVFGWLVDWRFPQPALRVWSFARVVCRTRETVYLLGYQFIIKGYNLEQPKGIDAQSRSGERAQSRHAVSRHAALPTPPPAHRPRSLPSVSFWVFTEASLSHHDWLNHWPLATDSTSGPSPLLRGGLGESGWNLQPLIMWSVPLATSPHPQRLSKSHFINTVRCAWKALVKNNENQLHLCTSGAISGPEDKRCPHSSYHLGNKKVLGAICWESWTKTKFFF